jgi:hypothetical protein
MKHTAKLDLDKDKHFIDPDHYIQNGLYYVMNSKAQSLEVNHKGKDCVVSNILCQESYCSNCAIFKNDRR